MHGLFECKPGSIGDAAVGGAIDDASKSTTVEPTTETKSVSSSSTHHSKLSSKLLSLSASVRKQTTNTNDSPQPSPPPPPPPPPFHVPKEESNLHLLVSKLWTAETVDTNLATKQDTTEDNGQCDSSVSKSRTEMIKAANKAVTKDKDAKGNKSFVARASMVH